MAIFKKNKQNKKVKKKPNRRAKWTFRFVFLIGLLVALYPLINRIYYRIDSNNQVNVFNEGVNKLDTAEIERRMGLARAYNDSLVNNVSEDPYAKDKHAKGRAEYARMLEVHEMIGHVEIPKINQDLPIYAGTAEEVLQKGVGHLEGTSLPIGGNSTHSVLTAHSGLPEATLFTHLNELEIGDKFYVHNIAEILAYQVDQIKVIEPSNFSDLLISPGHDYVTLLTCTPIMINSHRLIVRGHRVPYVPAVDEELIRTTKANWIFRLLFFLALFLIIVLIVYLWRLRRDNKRYYSRIEEIKKRQEELLKKSKKVREDEK
ncbi:class C sortase [Anaerococcus tetradius]|uniref:Sortase family protein n=1 Tax=Anaerococcus tetradius ATCC 35098 TaxID=525255 RepID=C2CK89_9FIRM|nr:class C sortase [Anaerococcus tetradius]EEI82020.1 sortase family protein [Anaerococcus tetradius ATCC 35098]